MRKLFFLGAIIFFTASAHAQKIESIYFNLYTDSLKKGFFNYINVDGKLSDGSWSPLDSTHLFFTANTGRFKGNDLFIDSSYTGDKVVVKAILKSNPSIYKDVIIYIRRRGFTEPLKSSEEILEEMKANSKKPKK
ncbi:MAG TPA: hypothetical protein VM935_08835 [Chitinophagaceae bacterium]|nr:hypothetical protein [Chitinophagaceae bacterium]